jgi:ribonuclease HI
MQVPGHMAIEGNETADQLARLGPELAYGISAGTAKKTRLSGTGQTETT